MLPFVERRICRVLPQVYTLETGVSAVTFMITTLRRPLTKHASAELHTCKKPTVVCLVRKQARSREVKIRRRTPRFYNPARKQIWRERLVRKPICRSASNWEEVARCLPVRSGIAGGERSAGGDGCDAMLPAGRPSDRATPAARTPEPGIDEARRLGGDLVLVQWREAGSASSSRSHSRGLGPSAAGDPLTLGLCSGPKIQHQ